MDRLEKLPEFEDVKKGIDELLLIKDWDKYKIKRSPKKFNKRMTNLFIKKMGILPQILTLSNTDKIPFTFYRLRKQASHMNISLISEYSYPPNHMIKYTQRANIPYHPVFYCSDQPITAIFETIRNDKSINPKHYYYLSEWQFEPNHDLRISPFLFGNLDESSPYTTLTENSYNKLERILKGHYPKDNIEGFKKIMEFLSHLFIYENTYTVSSFLAHYHLYADHNLRSDLFIYPSWQTKRKSVNFAIHPNTVSEKLRLKRVYRMTVQEFNEQKQSVTYNVDQIGTNKDSIIYWKWFDKEDVEQDNLLKRVFEQNNKSPN